MDNKVSAADARLALRCSVGLEAFDDFQKNSADIDRDGRITSADARNILRMSVGLPSDVTEISEYQILLSGTYYLTGLTYDGKTYSKCEIASTESSFYNLIKMKLKNIEVETVAFRRGDDFYLILPDKDAYTELTKSMQLMLGITSSDYSESFDLSGFAELKDAVSVSTSTVNGIKTNRYLFKNHRNSYVVYIADKKVIQLEFYNENELISRVFPDFITNVIPEEKMSVKFYSKYDQFSFIEMLKEQV